MLLTCEEAPLKSSELTALCQFERFPGGTSRKDPACQCWRLRHRFDPWVGKIPWRMAWQPAPVFLPGESHEWRSLAGYSPSGHKESDMTEQLSTHTHATLWWEKATSQRKVSALWLALHLCGPHSTAARGSGLNEKGLELYLDLQLSPASSYLCLPTPQQVTVTLWDLPSLLSVGSELEWYFNRFGWDDMPTNRNGRTYSRSSGQQLLIIPTGIEPYINHHRSLTLIHPQKNISIKNCTWNLVQFSSSVMSDILQPYELQHARPPCPSPTPGAYPNPCPLSQWCHPAISSSVIPFSSYPQSFPALGSSPMSQLFTSGGLRIGISVSTSGLPMNTQDWSPSGWTGCISLQSKGLLRVFSNTTVQKHQFFGTQLSL